ncbi:MAG: hypothetical protein V2J62_00325 [candidate division KSB1 bacterium]|nr:hypothetical protein [candidate division KSB1 bacterium]
MEKAARKAIVTCLKLRENELAVIIVDARTRELGHLLLRAAHRVCPDTVLIEKRVACKESEELPPVFNIFPDYVNAVIMATSHSISHTKAIKSAIRQGARVICLSQLSMDTIERCVNTDFNYIQEKSTKLADLFTIGKQAILTTPAGTYIEIPIARRKGVAHTGIAARPGVLSRLPAGSASVRTDKTKLQGVVVVDGSLGSHGLVKHPLRFDIDAAYIKKISGRAEADMLRKIMKPFGKQARHVTEFGIGTNPDAQITGKSIEDKNALGSVNFTLGLPVDGKSRKKECSVDVILKCPTLVIDGHEILKNGKILV